MGTYGWLPMLLVQRVFLMGTRFFATQGYVNASGIYKNALVKSSESDTAIIKASIGFPARVLLAKGPVVLVFDRGGGCPLCNMQLKAYQQILPDIQAIGAKLIAITSQKPDHSLSLQEKEGLEFQVLSDPNGLVTVQVQSALRCFAGSKGSHGRFRNRSCGIQQYLEIGFDGSGYFHD
jgi:hypothetical protein